MNDFKQLSIFIEVIKLIGYEIVSSEALTNFTKNSDYFKRLRVLEIRIVRRWNLPLFCLTWNQNQFELNTVFFSHTSNLEPKMTERYSNKRKKKIMPGSRFVAIFFGNFSFIGKSLCNLLIVCTNFNASNKSKVLILTFLEWLPKNVP